MALGRKASAEPLSSEDMALLAAVAAQAATALENGRLYRQLTVKADELERMREFSENILESLNDGLAVVDRDDRVVRWNRRLEELYGVRHEEAVGRRLEQIFDAGLLRDPALGAGASRPTARRSTACRSRRGTRRRGALLVNVATTPLRDMAGAIAGTIVVIEDISARVQLEEQLQISEKMASIGLLAAGVAHEVNTPLTGISSFVQMLLQGTEPDDPKTQVLEKIERQTFRAAKIVNGLLNLARPAQVDSGPVDVNAVINDVLSLLEHQLRTGRIQVRKELAATAPVVQGIEYKLQQVFLNLFLNARDAMPKGGWLTIVTRADGRRRDGRGRRHRLGHPGRAAVAHLRSVLHDQGHRQGHRPRAVDHLRHRAGARRHDHLRQRARARARASRWRCRSRRARSNAGVAQSSGVTSAGHRAGMNKNGSILVIDDEEIMREILEALLTREGYTVRLAADAAEGPRARPHRLRSTPPSST